MEIYLSYESLILLNIVIRRVLACASNSNTMNPYRPHVDVEGNIGVLWVSMFTLFDQINIQEHRWIYMKWNE